MSYLDNLGRASYVAPNGNLHEFKFTILTRNVTHRIGAFEFPGVNGTLHQDKGTSGEVYPMTVIFHGDTFDLEADNFINDSKLPGRGVLIHPRWGQKDVQIISCTQSEDWVNELGQAVISVEFQESLDREFAIPAASSLFEVSELAEGYASFAESNYGEQIVTDTLDQQNSFKDVMTVATARVYTALATLATGDDLISAKFFGGIQDITTNIDEYISAPQRFAEQLIRVIWIPATLVGRVDAKLQAYGSLLDSLPFRNVDDDSRETKNGLLTDELVGSAAVTGAALGINQAVGNTSAIQRDDKGRALITTPPATEGFQTRAEAVAAALYLRALFNFLTNYLDTGQASFLDKTLYEAYVQTIENFGGEAAVVNKVIQSSLNLSFTLPAKRSFILTEASTIINQCYNLYGGVADATLDYFIQTNNLTGAEIKLLPKNKEVVYYA